VYYVPIWFQSIKGVDAVQSGIRLLPLMLGMVVASVLTGLLNQRVGYYTAFGIAGACMMSVGTGLLTTLQIDTSEARLIGYQLLYGFGMGMCFQTPNLATQTVLPKRDVPMGLALMFFGQLVGAAVFVSVGQNVLDNQLLKRLSGIPGFSKSLVTSGGATSILDSVPPELRGTVLKAYNEALRSVFQIGVVLACLAVPGEAMLEWRSILKEPEVKVGNEKGVQGDAQGASPTASES
jgi:MFS family permease